MPTHSPEGDRTKRYEKIDFLGEGQFATVYKAKDTQDDNKIVAGTINWLLLCLKWLFLKDAIGG